MLKLKCILLHIGSVNLMLDHYYLLEWTMMKPQPHHIIIQYNYKWTRKNKTSTSCMADNAITRLDNRQYIQEKVRN